MKLKDMKANVATTVKPTIDKATAVLIKSIHPVVYKSIKDTIRDMGEAATARTAYNVVYAGILDATRGSISETARPASKYILNVTITGLTPQASAEEILKTLNSERGWAISQTAGMIIRALSLLPKEKKDDALKAWQATGRNLLLHEKLPIQPAVLDWMSKVGVPSENYKTVDNPAVFSGVRLVKTIKSPAQKKAEARAKKLKAGATAAAASRAKSAQAKQTAVKAATPKPKTRTKKSA